MFAYPERQYKKIRRTAIQRGRQYLEESPPAAFSFAFDGQRTVQQVITSYYLAMRTFEVVGASPEQWANLWLRLVWIYEDLKEEQLALEAAEKARNYFAEAMSTTARSAAGDQQLYILLGELELRLGRGGEAFRNFHTAATMRGEILATKGWPLIEFRICVSSEAHRLRDNTLHTKHLPS